MTRSPRNTIAITQDDRLLFGMHLMQGMASLPMFDGYDRCSTRKLETQIQETNTHTHTQHTTHRLFNQSDWKFFVKLSSAHEIPATGRDVPSWVDIESVAAFEALKYGVYSFSSVPPSLTNEDHHPNPSSRTLLRTELPALYKQLEPQREADTWYRWMQSTTPESDMPAHLTDASTFQKLVLVQVLRPDRLTSAMDAFVRKTLSLPSLTPPEIHMEQYAKLTEPTEAVLMVTTPGADPSLQVEEMAFRVVGRTRFVQIAMGGGQTEEAMVQLRRCAAEGKWLLLKNLHLVISWVPALEKELNGLRPDPNFRLWLTTEPHDKFPTVLATHSVKVTFEAPPGIKKSLLRTYEQWTPEYLQAQTPLRCQVLFSLAWFHGLVLERRTYVPQGWYAARGEWAPPSLCRTPYPLHTGPRSTSSVLPISDRPQMSSLLRFVARILFALTHTRAPILHLHSPKTSAQTGRQSTACLRTLFTEDAWTTTLMFGCL